MDHSADKIRSFNGIIQPPNRVYTHFSLLLLWWLIFTPDISKQWHPVFPQGMKLETMWKENDVLVSGNKLASAPGCRPEVFTSVVLYLLFEEAVSKWLNNFLFLFFWFTVRVQASETHFGLLWSHFPHSLNAKCCRESSQYITSPVMLEKLNVSKLWAGVFVKAEVKVEYDQTEVRWSES